MKLAKLKITKEEKEKLNDLSRSRTQPLRTVRSFLKQIRVKSIEELKERILKGVKEINDVPVVHRWRNFDFASNQ